MNITPSSFTVFLDYNILRSIVWIIVCIAIPGNIFVITQMMLTLRRTTLARKVGPVQFSLYSRLNIQKNPALFILFNLAITDLLGGIYLLILIVGDIMYSHYGNNILAFNATDNISIITYQWITSGSCFTARLFAQLTIIMKAAMSLSLAVNRYRSVYYPYSRRSKIKFYRLLIAICWILSIAFALCVTSWSMKVLDGAPIGKFSIISRMCIMDKGLGHILRALGLSQLFLGCACYICVIILYIKISHRLKRSRRQFASDVSDNINREIQILSTVIVLTDVIAFIGITFVSLFLLQSGQTEWNEIMAILLVLLYANTAIDPLVYLLFRSRIVRSVISWLNIRMTWLLTPIERNIVSVPTDNIHLGDMTASHHR